MVLDGKNKMDLGDGPAETLTCRRARSVQKVQQHNKNS